MATPDERQRDIWDRSAARYDQLIAPLDKRFMAPSRRWIGARAAGEVLEIAIGTGLNLKHYPAGVAVTGIDVSEPMLESAGAKARDLDLDVTLLAGDALDLPFDDASFDSVVSTFAMCGVEDDERALAEMVRVVRPNGRILLADHVASTNPVVHGMQWALEAVTKRINGEHWTRRPLPVLERLGVQIVDSGRSHVGVIEHVHARKR